MDSGDRIRILDLLPGDDEDVIRCTVRATGLRDGEPYECLSYVWGDSSKLRTISLADEVVEVTETLYFALRRLRRQTNTRALWVDQLCIDQWDTKQKTQQVNMMRDIYGGCTQCLIWLGEIAGDDEDSQVHDAAAAFDFIQLCATHFGDSDGTNQIPPSLSTPSQRDGAYRAFKAFSLHGNPWWNRIWYVWRSCKQISCFQLLSSRYCVP